MLWKSFLSGYLQETSIDLPPYLCKEIFGIKLEGGCASLLMLRFDKGASQFLKLQ